MAQPIRWRLNGQPAQSGAGEPSTRPVAAALANALFDATGRLSAGPTFSILPFTPPHDAP
jgi:CO/xanthine dehydrogenase Mo-binding subunit